jgi:hypothetical protein
MAFTFAAHLPHFHLTQDLVEGLTIGAVVGLILASSLYMYATRDTPW